MSDKTKFWMVTRHDGNRSPTVRHTTREAAEAEATRLAEKELSTFFVLEAVSRHSVQFTHTKTELQLTK